jgi:hypothetical protein
MAESKGLVEFAEAFMIFAKYGDESHSVQTAHDEIFAGPDPSVVSDEDRARLKELGWMESIENECFSIFT